MAGPINSTPGTRPLSRPGASPAPEATLPEPKASGARPLARDVNQAQGRPGGDNALPDLRSQVGNVSLDDFLAAGPGKRTPLEARQAADAVWFAVGEDTGFTRAERDADDVNEAMTDPFGTPLPRDMAGAQAAQDEIRANHELEEAALHKLSKSEQAQYQAIAKGMGDDPKARLALQILLLEGTLTKGPKAKDGDTLLKSLHELATKPVAKGVNRQELVADVVQEIATPSAIAQKNRGTCTATTLQIKMAMERPAEYARLVAGLASPEGKVTMANGMSLVREPGTGTGAKIQAQYQGKPVMIEDLRSVSSQLWQPALMQYGYGPKNDYDNKTDTVSGGAAPGVGMVSRMMDGLSGKGSAFVRSWREEGGEKVDNRMAMLESLRQAVADRPVAVGLVWGEKGNQGGHEVLVTRMDDERVYFNNPHGKEESMALGEFHERLQGGFIHTADFSGAR